MCNVVPQLVASLTAVCRPAWYVGCCVQMWKSDGGVGQAVTLSCVTAYYSGLCNMVCVKAQSMPEADVVLKGVPFNALCTHAGSVCPVSADQLMSPADRASVEA